MLKTILEKQKYNMIIKNTEIVLANNTEKKICNKHNKRKKRNSTNDLNNEKEI